MLMPIFTGNQQFGTKNNSKTDPESSAHLRIIQKHFAQMTPALGKQGSSQPRSNAASSSEAFPDQTDAVPIKKRKKKKIGL